MPLLTFIPTVHAAPVNLGDEYAFGGIDSFGEGVTFIATPAFTIAGIILVFWFLWAAFDMIISNGDKEKVAAARNKITHTLIGFLLLFVLFLLIQYLPEVLLPGSGFQIIGR